MKDFIGQILAGSSPNLDECIAALGELELLTRLRETPQDPEWHAEGDVHVHTALVMAEAYRLLEGPAEHLTGHRRLLLILGALLHDIAKPLCTREEERRGAMHITARRHETRGRSYLALRLLEAGLPYDVLETLLGLVGYHQEPKFLVVKEKPSGAYQRVCRVADPELLYWLELADMRGRKAYDRQENIDQIELYRLFAGEYRAFVRGGEHKPEWTERLVEAMDGHAEAAIDRVVANAQRSFEADTIKSIEEALARSFGQRGAFSDLVLTVGPSGCGKSTFIDRHLEGFDVVSLDDLRQEIAKDRADQSHNDQVLVEARERLKEGLRKKRPVVWDATSLRKDFRTRIAGLGFDYDALVTLVVFHTSLETIKAQNRNRSQAVPEKVLARQIDQLEWPGLDEAHRVIYLDRHHRVLGAFGVNGSLPYNLESVEP